MLHQKCKPRSAVYHCKQSEEQAERVYAYCGLVFPLRLRSVGIRFLKAWEP